MPERQPEQPFGIVCVEGTRVRARERPNREASLVAHTRGHSLCMYRTRQACVSPTARHRVIDCCTQLLIRLGSDAAAGIRPARPANPLLLAVESHVVILLRHKDLSVLYGKRLGEGKVRGSYHRRVANDQKASRTGVPHTEAHRAGSRRGAPKERDGETHTRARAHTHTEREAYAGSPVRR